LDTEKGLGVEPESGTYQSRWLSPGVDRSCRAWKLAVVIATVDESSPL